MKKIKWLNDFVKDFGGEPVLPGDTGKFLLLKTLFLQILSSHLKPGKEEVFQAMELGKKIHLAKNDLLLEEAELAFLKMSLEETRIPFGAIVRKPLYDMLENAKDFDPNKKIKGEDK